ncbi:DNA polymerase IV [Paucilactobacillus sp. N302-9]
MAEFMQVPLNVNTSRKIIHIDMDAFYAQIEMRDHPQWRNKPLVIAKDPRKTGGHGVVTTANYVARKQGVHSAMPAQKALELAPNAIFKTPDFPLYREISHQIHEIFHEYTDKIEPIAFDEAYLDVTENKKGLHSAIEVAHQLQAEIFAKTNLTCSTGISYNKFLAKLASDYMKPVSVTIVRYEDVHDFLMRLPIEKFRGVGKKTVPKMHDLGILTGQELYDQSENDLIKNFGKLGYALYRRVRGSDDRPVEYQRDRKSIGKERTFNPFLTTNEQVDTQLKKIAQLVEQTLRTQQKHGKTLVVKARNQDFETITKRHTEDDYLPVDAQTIYELAKSIFETVHRSGDSMRLLGITITNLAPLKYENMTLPLFKEQLTSNFDVSD